MVESLIVTRPLTDFGVLTFDCYGTLIDWETGIWDALQPLISHNRRSDISRTRALAVYGRHESRQQAATPELAYPAVLAAAHRGVAEEFGLETNPELDAAFGASVPAWPAFADTAESLRFLSTRYQLVILSNIDNASFAASNRKLGVDFDAVYTAEDIGSYKPDPANFEYLLDHLSADLGRGRQDILHTAQSLFHDHVPAINHGLATAWIDRQRLSEGGTWGATATVEDQPATDFRFFTLAEMAAAVAAT
ncbi:MAG TPA: haloacid dehalogenase type II [Acidimicrobiia bacterium]|nr:haloacid dehalogenase type II [Acidimicrobiia bacterium]